MHLIDENSHVRNSVCYNHGKEIELSVALHNAVVELIPKCLKSPISKKAMWFLRMHK